MLKAVFSVIFCAVLLVSCTQTEPALFAQAAQTVKPGTSWQYQLAFPPKPSNLLDVDLYNVDLFDTPKSTITEMQRRGITVICYFSAGSGENWRPDHKAIPKAALGKALDGWAGERWLDTRNSGVRKVMTKRLDLAASKGCDGVEPDNVDAYSNRSGFRLTASTQLSYNRFLAEGARQRGLLVALKNDVEQVKALEPYFDFAINEECYTYRECGVYSAFTNAGKAVLGVEYDMSLSKFCPAANAAGYDFMRKGLKLGSYREACREYSAPEPEPTPEPTPEPEPQPTPTPEPTPEPTPQPEPTPEPSPIGNAVRVTNLNDSGAGSLRACVEAATGPRTCVFTVAGTITLSSRLRLAGTGVTLAGETAPAPGITLKGNGQHDDPLLEIRASDFEVRHLRFRRGPGGGHDNITIASTSRDGYLHHNSISWATDENINTYRDVHNVTWAYNIIAEPLHCSTHPKGCHGKNGAMGKYETGSQTFYRNLIMSGHDRNLKLNSSYGVINYVNNVMYNNYDVTNVNGEYLTGPVCINVVGNVWKDGPDSSAAMPQVRADANLSVYMADNVVERNAVPSKVLRASPCAGLPDALSAQDAYSDVLAKAGAWPRDATDARLVNEVKTNTGSFKNSVP
jgi:hypothetical protein